jgi:hypothetical protein
MSPNCPTDAGHTVAISRSVASWKMTYAGTPCSRACSARQARRASKAGCNDSGNSTAAALALRSPRPGDDDPDREPAGFFGSLRSGTSRSRRSTVPLASVSTSVPYSPSTASSPCASNCRTTPRHSPSARSSPMPNTDNWSWSNWITLAVRRPMRMSTICTAPNFWPRSRCSRTTVDSTFWAATVPSQVSGGVRQVSQLPQAAASGSCPK